MGRRKFSVFAHIFAIIISVAAIALYFVFPLWRISAVYTVSPSQIKTMLGSSFGDYDLDDALPEEGVDVHIKLNISVPSLCVAVVSGTKAVNKIIDDNVDSVTDELVATIGDVTKTITKTVIKETIKTEIKNQIKEFLSNSSSDGSDDATLDGDAQEILDELDSSGFVDKGADAIVEALYADNATITSVTDTTVNIVRDAITELQNGGDEKVKDITFDEETEKSVREAIEDAISQYANEDGTIDMDETMQQYLLDALKGLLNNSAAASSEAALFGATITAADTETSSETTTETTSATKTEIKTALADYINGIIPDAAALCIFIALIVLLVLFVASFACWVYQLVRAIVWLAKGEEGKALALPIVFGMIPGFILMLIPTVALLIINAAFAIGIFSVLSLSFFSSGVCSAGAAVILIILAIVRHNVLPAQSGSPKSGSKSAERTYGKPEESGDSPEVQLL